MGSAITVNKAFWLISGLLTVVIAQGPLATLSPCSACPKAVAPSPITITSQYQPVSTCTPHTACTKSLTQKSCKVEPECTTYDWVSTKIPCDGGASTTLVTKTEQIVKLAHVSTILTSLLPCPTSSTTIKPWWNGTATSTTRGACTSTKLQTMVVDISCPYNQMGPMALPPYAGSGLCSTCAEKKDGSKSQIVTVTKCLDGQCSTYAETWVSTKQLPASTTSVAAFSSHTYCPSGGVYTVPVTTTCTPSAPGYSKPVTSTFSITTSVANAQTIDIIKTITITFTGEPAPSSQSSLSECPITTQTYCPSNGVYTYPIVTTVTPNNPVYTPVVTTCFHTTTVTDAPRPVDITTTITVYFTSTYCPATVVSGT